MSATSATTAAVPGRALPGDREGLDVVATLALAAYSFVAALGFARVFADWQFVRDVGVIVIVVLALLILFNAVRIVREYQRLVVFRLGKFLATKGPGFVILIPFIDKAITVDLREFYLEIPRQDSITKDNAPIGVDFIGRDS